MCLKHPLSMSLISVLCLSGMNTALAEPTRQLSVSVGTSQQDLGSVSQTLTSKGYTNVTSNADKRDTAWKIGYQHPLNTNWSANVAYVDLGDTNATISAGLPAGKTNSAAAREIADSLPKRGRGLTASALYHKPLSAQWSAQIGLGAYAYRDERSATVSGVKETVKTSGVRPLAHLGISYQLNPKTSIQGEWDHYFMSDKDIGQVGIGIAYSF